MQSRRTVLALVWSAVALVVVLAAIGWLRSLREPQPQAPPPAADPGTGEVETILFPILLGPEPLRIGEREWKTMVIATSRHKEPFFIGFDGQPIAIVPGTSRPREFGQTALSGGRALGPENLVGEVTFDLLLRDEASGAVVAVPVLTGDGLTEPMLAIEGLGAGEGSRTLRLFDALRTAGGRVDVRVLRGEEVLGETIAELVQVEPIGPTFADLDLSTLGVTGGAGVRIELEALTPSMQLWAMVVETDGGGMIRIVPASADDAVVD